VAASDAKLEENFNWCFPTSSKQLKTSGLLKFAPPAPSKDTRKNCVTAQFNSNGIVLTDDDCSMENNFICEVNKIKKFPNFKSLIFW